MFLRLIYLSIFFRISCILQAQEIQFFLKDEVLEQPIAFATIYNLNTQQYILSDEQVFFKFGASIGDSLEIQHLSYEKKIIVVDKTEMTILLFPKVTFLDEIQVGNISSNYLGYFGKKTVMKRYFLGMNFKYALRIPNNLQSSTVVKTVEIPVNYENRLFMEDLIDEVFFSIQFIKRNKDGSPSDIPLSDVYSIPITEKKVKKLVFEFDSTSIKIPPVDFFIVLSRVVPNKTYDENADTYSASPALKVQTLGKETDTYIWSINFDNDWREMTEEECLYIPLFQITIEVEPVE